MREDEAKETVFSNNSDVLQRKCDKETERKKKKRFEYIFPKHLRSVGGEQHSDTEGAGHRQKIHIRTAVSSMRG